VFTKALEKKKAATKENLAKTNYSPQASTKPRYLKSCRTSTEVARDGHAISLSASPSFFA